MAGTPFESFLIGYLASLLYDQSKRGVDEIHRGLSDDPEFREMLLEEFKDELESRLQSRFPESASIDSEEILRRYESGPSPDADEIVLTSDNEESKEQLAIAVVDTSVPEDFRSNHLRQSAKSAIDESIIEATDSFIDYSVERGLADQLNLKLNLELVKKVNSLAEDGEGTEYNSEINQHFTIHNTGVEKFTIEQFRTLDVSEDYHPEFVQRPVLSESDHTSNNLFIGQKGAGKSRCLSHMAKKAIDEGNVDFLIELENSFTEQDVQPLLSNLPSGDILIICDDLGRLQQLGETHPFRLLLSRLWTEANDDSNIISYASVRSETISNLPEINRENDDHIWKQFDFTSLGILRPDEVSEIANSVFEEEGCDVAEDTSDRIVNQIMRYSPTPLYTISSAEFCAQNYDLSKEVVNIELPSGVTEIWRNHYRTIRSEDKQSERLLMTLKTVREFLLPNSIGLTKEIFQGVFEGDILDFERALSRLLREQWAVLSEIQDEGETIRRIYLHDAKLEAVSEPPVEIIRKFREYLLNWSPEKEVDDEAIARLQLRIANAVQYSFNGSFEETEPHLKRADELCPNSWFIQNCIGVIYRSNRQWQQAKKHLERAIESAPDNPIVNYNYGRCIDPSNPKISALEPMKTAAESDVEDPRYYHGYGHALLARRKPEQAKEQFNKAIDAGGKFPELYFSKGDSHCMLEEFSKARDCLNTAISLFDEERQTLNLINAYLLLSVINYNDSQFGKSEKAAERGLSFIRKIENGSLEPNPAVNDMVLDADSLKSQLIQRAAEAVLAQDLS